MYEKLTGLLTDLQNDPFGEWITDKENDGSPGHPIQMAYVKYSDCVRRFRNVLYQFLDDHPDLMPEGYQDTLKKAGIEWGDAPMKNADVSDLDAQTVLALLLGAVRADRFCEGALLDFLQSGCITKWLSRLREIDQ